MKFIGLIFFPFQIAFQLNTYNSKEEVLNALAFDNDITVLGTNTAEALDMVRRQVFTSANGDRNGVENWAIVIHDGFSNINSDNTVPSATDLKNNGVRVVSIGLGDSMNRAEIEAIASVPENDNEFYLENGQQLGNVASDILDQICL